MSIKARYASFKAFAEQIDTVRKSSEGMWEPLEEGICIFLIIILRFAIGETSFCSKAWIATDGQSFQQNIFARKTTFFPRKKVVQNH